MNHIYRLIWSELLNAWVAVAESASGRGKGSSRRLVAAALSLCATVQAAPNDGQVVSGVGSISQSGATTTIQQSSPNLSLDWKSFNVAPQETVNFRQPSAAAIAVNRILDTNGTRILGQLTANGQVWLVNPNGILFGPGARVNVGGLVASTLDLNDTGLNGNARTFSGNGTGSVVNQGTIDAANGGYVALLGNTVSNQGTITARLGTVALGAGSAATLTFSGTSLVRMQVDQSVLASLADNGGLINADGGMVLMSAGAKNALLASVVNNTGVVEARTVENHEGVITLLGGMTAGAVNVGGRLDASAPDGGNGGFIETSAAQVKVANDARVSTAAPTGRYGSWLIDPQDYTVAAVGGDLTGATLSANLGTTAIILESSGGGSAGSGNVNVSDAVSWSANTTLTLIASNNVNINADITATGATAGLVISPGTANGGEPANAMGVYSLNNGASVTLSGTNPSLSIAGVAYTVINSLGAAADASTAPAMPTLQGMAAPANLAGKYALGSDIDAAATATWNAGAGFTPAGDLATQFTGTFDGLGHTISNLVINRPATNFVGLFGYHAGPAIRNVGLAGGSVSGNDGVGGLVGYKFGGTVSNSYATGNVTAVRTTGGLLGYNNAATVRDSYATGSVSGSFSFPVGGLVGQAMNGTISNSYATGNVSGTGSAGGLVGLTQSGSTVSDSSATGNVSMTGTNHNAGGLVGYNNASTVSNSSATGSVAATGSDNNVGGLVGLNMMGTVSDSSATGGVSGTGSNSNVGGLVGWMIVSGAVSNSFATGSVTGNGNVGGLVGHNASFGSTSITNSHARGIVMGTGLVGGLVGTNEATGSVRSSNHTTGSVSGSGASDYVGGLVGFNRGTVSDSYATSDISATGMPGYVGGLVGNNFGTVNTSYAHGSVSGTGNAGGLVGGNSGTVSISYAAGSVSGTGDYVGGFVGENYGTITDAYATGAVAGAGSVGGLAGINYNSVSNTYATGSVSGTSAVGGLVGTNDGSAAIGNSYWNSEVNPISTIGVGSGPGSATGMTIAQMRQQGNFSSSWDFSNTWIAYNGLAYPLLRYFMTPLTVTADNMVKPYDALSANPTGVAYSAAPNANLLGTLGYGGAKDVGTYAPGGLFSNQHGYMISYVDGQLTIAPYAVSLTGTRAYDGTLDMAAGALTLGVLANGETLALSGTGSVADKNAGGPKAVTLGTLALGNGTGLASNYTFSGGTQTASITQAALTLSTSDVTRAYDGGLTAAGTAVVTSGTLYTGAGDTLTGGTFAFTDKNVGSADRIVTIGGVTVGDGINSGNYDVSYVDNTTSTINKAPLTVTADNQSRLYGAPNPVFSETLSGFVPGESSAVITGTPTGSSAAGSGTSVGTSAITANAAGLSAANYEFTTFVPGTLTITPAPLTVTANADSKTYNGVAYSGGNGVAYSGFVNGETSSALSGTLSYGGTSQGATDAGSYDIAPGGLTSGNYKVGYVNGTLTIGPVVQTSQPGPQPEPVLTPPSRVLNASSQIQSELTSFNVLDQHQTLLLSPTIGGEANSYLKEVVVVGNKETRINIGGLGPILRVVNGGVRLPDNLVMVNE